MSLPQIREADGGPDDQAEPTGEIVVLTGSSGCLGHQTLELLISHDERVLEIRCLDLVEPSESAKRSVRDELAKLKVKKRVKYVQGDIRDINTVEACLDGADCVIHCAARIDFWVDPDEQDAGELESINVHGTENLLRACVRFGVPKFVHVSSFETFVSYHTIYYATESTLPEPKWLLFGPSGQTKLDAEAKVRQFSSNKLRRNARLASRDKPRDSLNAVIIRFTQIYGPGDKYFVTRLLKIAKFFGGTLKRFTNVWIRQQPIYVGNAAWSLIKAKQRLDVDESISGEEFHITDETKIGDPFDFLEPFAECKNMQIGKTPLPAWPIWLLIILFTFLRKSLVALDFFNLFTGKKSRVEEAKERDRAVMERQLKTAKSIGGGGGAGGQHLQESCTDLADPFAINSSKTRWYHLVTSQTFYFICNSLFLNRTKASLRLNYEPLFSPEESMSQSLDWYKNHLQI